MNSFLYRSRIALELGLELVVFRLRGRQLRLCALCVQLLVFRIEPGENFAGLHDRADFHIARDDLSRHPETQIGFVAGPHVARIGDFAVARRRLTRTTLTRRGFGRLGFFLAACGEGGKHTQHPCDANPGSVRQPVFNMHSNHGLIREVHRVRGDGWLKNYGYGPSRFQHGGLVGGGTCFHHVAQRVGILLPVGKRERRTRR